MLSLSERSEGLTTFEILPQEVSTALGGLRKFCWPDSGFRGST
jgi:hypothetical protein